MRATLLLPCLVVAACDYPRIDPAADLPGSVLAGSVLVESDDTAGKTLLFLSPEASPMPPLGVSSPVSFATLPGDAYGPAGSLLKSAPFSFTDLAPERWLITAVHDTDDNFHPGVTALATPTCGDWFGWHLDSLDGLPTAIDVGEHELIEGVVVGPLALIDSPNPSFTATGDTTLVANGTVRLEALAVSGTFGGVTLTTTPFDRSKACTSGFRFVRRDADGDGGADASELLPLIEDRWPRVVFQWLGTPVVTGDGLAFDRGDVPDDVTIAAIGDPSVEGDLPAPGVPVDVDTLLVRFTAFGQRIEPDGTSTIIAGADMPPGAWSATLIALSGQLWTLPNEMGDIAAAAALPEPGRQSEIDPTQGVVFTLP